MEKGRVKEMDQNVEFILERRVERTMEALVKNRMEAYYAPSAEKAKEAVISLLREGAVVSHGGSQTLIECGIIDELRSGKYNYLDRSAPGLSKEQVTEIYRRSFFADYYLGSANAITEEGELFNVDGNGNRVAAYIYGPQNVILVAGINKIVPDIESALTRLRKMAAPANVKRLECETPCFRTGECMNCHTPGRICCDYVVQGFQRVPGRIKVVLVGAPRGY